jgi:peptidyl-prolyl cis-trans isomerase SurA
MTTIRGLCCPIFKFSTVPGTRSRHRTLAALAAALAFAPMALAQNARTAAADPATPNLKPITVEQVPANAQPLAKKKSAGKSDAAGGQAGSQAAGAATAPTKTASRGSSSGASEQSIIALVNDEPITGYELQQRSMMLAGGGVQQKAQENFKAMLKNPRTSERLKAILAETIKANEGKTKEQIIAIFEQRKKQFAMDMQKQAVASATSTALPGMKKAALEELIEEKLKLQEAKRQGVAIGDDEINRVLTGIAERNKMTEAQFIAQLGGGVDAMKNRIRSTLSWNDVVRRKFGAQIAIGTKDIDKMVASSSATTQDDVELRVQRIRVAMVAKLDQSAVAQRMQDAEKIRAKFTDCKTSGVIANGVPGAKFEELGKRRPSAFQEPTRSLLLNAKDGEMLPPSMGEGGVELWIVCGRDVVKAEDQKRTQAEGELKQKEFELIAKRYLKDLRQDAQVEYR